MNETGGRAPTALVTGAAGGIGGTLLSAFRAAGYQTIGVDCVAAEGVMAVDITDADAVARCAARLEALDVLVNAAGVLRLQREYDLTEFTRVVEINLTGTMRMAMACRAALARAGGAIVNIASISALWHGRKTPGGLPGYDVAKAGMIRMTTRLASLAETDGIRVTCLAPGWIDVDGPRQYWESLTPAQRAERGVPSRLLTTNEIAAAVERLADDVSLAGRVLVWWSDDEPKLIRWGDRGYRDAVPLDVNR